MVTGREPAPAVHAERAPARAAAGGLRQRVRREVRRTDPSALLVMLGLVVVWLLFQSLNQHFLSPRNLSDISVDITGTGLIAVGVVFVLLIGEVDLSVGSVSGLAAALFAVLAVNHGAPEWLALIAAVLAGALIGAAQGLVFARLGVPAFVVTLAGLLGWNGLMLYVLGPDGTIPLDDNGLVASFTSRYFGHPAVAYGLAALGTAAYAAAQTWHTRRRAAAGMPHRSGAEVALRTAGLALPVFGAAAVLNAFHGMPLALLLFLAVVVGLDYVLRRTTYGRQVLSLGGGAEAARRAGLAVARIRVSVFALSGTLAALGGLFLASRITSASQTSGTGMLLMNAIAAAVIGGTSLFGGRGSPWSALRGALVIQSIASGMALMGIQSALQYMITAAVLLTAVTLDALTHPRPGRA